MLSRVIVTVFIAFTLLACGCSSLSSDLDRLDFLIEANEEQRARVGEFIARFEQSELVETLWFEHFHAELGD